MTKLPSGNYVDLTDGFGLIKTWEPLVDYAGLPMQHRVVVWNLVIPGFSKHIPLPEEDVEFVKEIAEARTKETTKGTA